MKSYVEFINENAARQGLITNQGLEPVPTTSTIKMKHQNIQHDIQTGARHVSEPETDEQRKARTGLSSLRVTDDASKAVQKTPNRVTLDSMLQRIVSEEYLHPKAMPHMTIGVFVLDNGFALTGISTPADPENYDEELGKRFAKEDAVRQMWRLEAYLLRERMTKQGEQTPA
jgi:hypothetical protein